MFENCFQAMEGFKIQTLASNIQSENTMKAVYHDNVCVDVISGLIGITIVEGTTLV